jgi:predicted nucleotidyltransferase
MRLLTMAKVSEILQKRRDEILKVAAKHGVSRVCVFGSAARGDFGPQSDIDFLIEPGPERTTFFPGGLLADLQELLGCNVDIVTEEGLHWYIRDRILKEAIPL